MSNPFFDHPILNSPYDYPQRHWELDATGQPTQKITESRRRAEFITPIPKPKKRKGIAPTQQNLVFDEGKGLSTQTQQYDPTSIINAVRAHVDAWRTLSDPADWHVTPETARLLQHWRHHGFSGVRPFFCQVEAIETAIWLAEVAERTKAGKSMLDDIRRASDEANPGVERIALKLATEADVETIIQRARERYPDARPRIISDNGPQFVAKDFKEFIRLCGMTQVRTSPYYPQSNGKIERWHRSLKSECIRPGVPLSLEDARRLVERYVRHYNEIRLHSAIGYVTPAAKMAGLEAVIHAERDRKLEAARERRKRARETARQAG